MFAIETIENAHKSQIYAVLNTKRTKAYKYIKIT